MKFFLPATLIAATALLCPAKDPRAMEATYNPATVIDVRGVVSDVRVVPAGNPLEGVHVTLKTKTEAFDVYLAPSSFLTFLKMTVAVGDDIRAIGSRVNGDSVLTKEFLKKTASVVLRDEDGTPVWKNWGTVIDPAHISQ